MIKCPNCDRPEGVHTCHIISLQKSAKEIHYHCALCNMDWTDNENQSDVQTAEQNTEHAEKKCHWCSHYISVASPENPKTSMVIGLNNNSGKLLFIDPTFCPICGKPMGDEH